MDPARGLVASCGRRSLLAYRQTLARRAPEGGLAPARGWLPHEPREAHMMLPVQIKQHLEGGRAGKHGR